MDLTSTKIVKGKDKTKVTMTDKVTCKSMTATIDKKNFDSCQELHGINLVDEVKLALKKQISTEEKNRG